LKKVAKKPAREGRTISNQSFLKPEPTTSKSWRVIVCKGYLKMKTDESQKPTDEMLALVANYRGKIKRIPQGKRVTRPPSKKPGESGSRQGIWGERQERLAFGD
jgi:hypothetical protein